MKQLITRIDDELHARVRHKAADEGTSVNELVKNLLEAAVRQSETVPQWKARMSDAGRVVTIEPDGPAPGRDRVAQLLQGAGSDIDEHLEWSRAER